MLGNFSMPPQGFGPGAQPDEGESLDYMALPSGMRTFEAHVPEIDDAAQAAGARALLQRLANACEEAACGKTAVFDLDVEDGPTRRLIAEALGEGEVAARIAGEPEIRAQESVFAGLWRVLAPGTDRLEVGPVPRAVRTRAFDPVVTATRRAAPMVPGVVNAPAMVVELVDRAKTWRPGDTPHVVNLTLLPHTPEDLAHLDAAFGRGSATLLSRGYGNCRIEATAVPRVWRVRFFNSMDSLILDTFEVTDVPEVALAAREDFEDSAARLREVEEAMR